MLLFGVFLRESARTVAKSRTNISTPSGKATKRLGRLAPNLAHMCKFIAYQKDKREEQHCVYKEANKAAKRAVAMAKEEAYEELYT